MCFNICYNVKTHYFGHVLIFNFRPILTWTSFWLWKILKTKKIIRQAPPSSADYSSNLAIKNVYTFFSFLFSCLECVLGVWSCRFFYIVFLCVRICCLWHYLSILLCINCWFEPYSRHVLYNAVNCWDFWNCCMAKARKFV